MRRAGAQRPLPTAACSRSASLRMHTRDRGAARACTAAALHARPLSQVIEGGLAIVPLLPPLAPSPSGRNAYPGVFGGQMTLPDAPLAAARIGMRTIRTPGAIWKQTQPIECWDETCFNWEHYDSGFFDLVGKEPQCITGAQADPRTASLRSLLS
jgi:hypothetical protein